VNLWIADVTKTVIYEADRKTGVEVVNWKKNERFYKKSIAVLLLLWQHPNTVAYTALRSASAIIPS
jgi:hypothetical protein